jgi:hypothetical protein
MHYNSQIYYYLKEKITMCNKTQFSIKSLILLSALASVSAQAELIFSDEVYTAFTSATTQLLPAVSDSDSETVPFESPGSVLALSQSPAGGQPFPNIPTSQTTAFASAAQLFSGNSVLTGVGANGFFLRNSLPPNTLEAGATYAVTITNPSTTAAEALVADIFIPTPTLQFFGNIGNSFPAGADPALDASARVQARVLTKVTHPDGSIVEDVLVDYGMFTFRNPQTGVFEALPISSDSVGLTRFDEPDGSFGFQLPELDLEGVTSPDLAELGPGDVMEFSYDFFATASTGFGETGIFAAIGDPFNLSGAGSGRIDIKVAGDPGSVVPIPGAVWLLSSGLLGLWGLRKGSKNQA